MGYTDHSPTITASAPRRSTSNVSTVADEGDSFFYPGMADKGTLPGYTAPYDPWSAESINSQFEGSTLMDTTGNKSGRPTYAYLGGGGYSTSSGGYRMPMPGDSDFGSPRSGGLGGNRGLNNELDTAKRDALLSILRSISTTGNGGTGSVTSATGRSFTDLFADANKAVAGDPLISQRSTSLSEGGRAAGETAGLRTMNSIGKGTGTAAGETLLGFAQAQGAAQGQQDAVAFENQNRNSYLGTLASLSEAQANRDQQAGLAEASLTQSRNQNLLDMLTRLGYLS